MAVRHRSCQKIVTFFIIACTIKILITYSQLRKTLSVPIPGIFHKTPKTLNEASPHKTDSCQVPWFLDAFEEDLWKHLNLSNIPPTQFCANKNYPHLFTTGVHTIIAIDTPHRLGFDSCFYEPFVESQEENSIRLSNISYALNFTGENVIPNHHEFLAVICENSTDPTMTSVMDLFAFVPLKLKPIAGSHTKYLRKLKKTHVKTPGHQLNIILFILESVSRLSLIRTMPLTYDFLKNNAFEMLGHTKISDNPFTNIMAMLTGRNVSELEEVGCAPSHEKKLDGCPFIWKDFSPLGYRTSLAEDGGDSSPFNFLKAGFAKQPTDYYLHPFVKILREGFAAKDGCYGPRLQLEYLLDYLNKTAAIMATTNTSRASSPFIADRGKRKKYFQVLISTMTHNNDSRLLFMDQSFRNLLETLRSQQTWDHTVLIFLSDQGSQPMLSGAGYKSPTIEKLIWLESVMPLLYIKLPQSFLTLYPEAGLNLNINRKQLTSHYDIYETLQHLKHIYVTGSFRTFPTATSRAHLGRSLFTNFDKENVRSCSNAGIPDAICPCGKLAKKLVTIPRGVKHRESFLEQAGSAAVFHLNLRLHRHQHPIYLSKHRILQVQIYELNEFMDIHIEMTIEFKSPCVNARRVVMKYDRHGKFKLIDDFPLGDSLQNGDGFRVSNTSCDYR